MTATLTAYLKANAARRFTYRGTILGNLDTRRPLTASGHAWAAMLGNLGTLAELRTHPDTSTSSIRPDSEGFYYLVASDVHYRGYLVDELVLAAE